MEEGGIAVADYGADFWGCGNSEKNLKTRILAGIFGNV